MAKLFLDSTDDAVVSVGNNFTVFGFAGKTVSVAAGVTGLTLKSSVEAVKFSGNVSDYTFLQTGTNVVVKNAAGVVVSTVAVQSDADGSALAFSNGTYEVKTVAPATAGALSTITFGGATINNADAATNNTAAAAPAAAAVVAGTAVTNALPVLTVPTTAASAIVGSTNAVTGVSFSDTDDNTGFTVKLQASGTSQVGFSGVSSAIVKDSTGGLLSANQGSNVVTISGTKTVLNTVLGNLQYTSNASIAGSESVTVTVTDAKGGSATSTINVAVAKQLTLATTTVTANLSGTANDDQFTGSLADFVRYTSPYSVVGAGGNDKLILSSVNGDVAGLASGISALELTLTGNSTLTVSASKFASSLTTVNASGNYTLGGTFNSGTTFNIAPAVSGTANGLTITNLLVPSTSVASAVTTDAVTVNLTTTTAGDITLASITDTATTIDILKINSNGSVANVIGTIGALATNATIQIAGAKDLTITNALPSLGTTGKVDASTLAGKLKLTTNAASTTVLGGSAADSITGGAGTDSITGNAGNDSIVGSNGSDTLSGGAGDDTLTGGSVIDSILGGDGGDSITGGAGNNILHGEAGNDIINGGADSDSIDGGADADSITGGGGSDTLVGGAGNDTIVGGTGVDAINGGTGADVLTGGITGVNTYTFALGDSGNTSTTRDQITDLKTTDVIKFGGYGITGLTSGSNLASLASSLTTKEIYVDQVNNRIVIETAVDGTTTEEITIPSSVGKAAFTYNNNGTASDLTDDYLTVGYAPLTKTNDGLGKLTLVGNTVADIYVKIETNQSPLVAGDTISGGITRSLDTSAVTGGAVSIVGSTGNDSIIGSALSDTINGGVGTDLITLGAGADTVEIAANGGTDTITDFVTGTDTLNIASGTTAHVFASTAVTGTSAITYAAVVNAGTLYINGATLSNGSTAVTGAETITGSTAVDSIVGGAGSDSIAGVAGVDSIIGNAGNDTLEGGVGSDIITGGAGDDSITGGAGTDTFIFEATASGNGADTIEGFKVGVVSTSATSTAAGDVLNFKNFLTSGTFVNTRASTAATAKYAVATAGALAASGTSIVVATNKVYLIKGAATAAAGVAYDTPTEIAALLANTGAWDAVDIAASANAVLIVGGTNAASKSFVYYVTNDATAAVDATEITLVGTINTAVPSDFVAGNFSFS